MHEARGAGPGAGGRSMTQSFDEVPDDDGFAERSWVPPGVDITVPQAARVYDYALGGVHNFEVDRVFWDRAEQILPGAGLIARANRQFLGRAVRRLVEVAGIRQFLDIGSGIPTLGNVHEVAQDANPHTRVVYVDKDPIAVRQSRSLLAGNPQARVIEADLLDPDRILFDPDVLDFLDFSQPIAVLTVAVLHFIPDAAKPASILAKIAEAVSAGSYLVVSHVGPDPTPEGLRAQQEALKLYERTPTPVTIRTVRELTAMIEPSFTILDPGVVAATSWYPDPEDDDEPPQPTALVAWARKP
jgi:SAM-dependent methyltransferase